MGRIDLHMHSKYSVDGELEIKELIDMAVGKHLEIIALSDHNSPLGIDEMVKLGTEAGIRVVPAMEFDTLFGQEEVHVLGYNLDYNQEYFHTIEAHINALIRKSFVDGMKQVQKHYGAYVNIEKTMAELDDGGNPFERVYGTIIKDPRNAHIKELAPYREGGSRSVPYVVNFCWDNLVVGAPCYVPVEFPTLKETVDIIHKYGGIAIIAHPWRTFYQKEELLDEAIKQGIDGVECYSNYHEPHHNEFYYEYCIKKNVLITCGSDYHGKFKPQIEMGEYGCDKDAMELCSKFLKRLDN